MESPTCIEEHVTHVVGLSCFMHDNMHNGTTQGMHMCALFSHALSTKMPRTEDVKLGIVPDVPSHVH